MCPAGIPIHDLILDVRERAVSEGHSSNTMKQRALGALADERLLERGARLAAKAPWLQALGRRLPGSPLKRRPLPNVQRRPFRDRIDEVAKSSREATTRVAYFPGCLTDWLSPETGEAAVAVLEALGFAVEPVQFSSCCGLPAINAGTRTRPRG